MTRLVCYLLILIAAAVVSPAKAQQQVYVCNFTEGVANRPPTCEVLITANAPTTSGAMTLVAGGTAQTLFAAMEVLHGCVIINPTTATEEGIGATEAISVSFTAVAAVGGGGVATTILEPGQAVSCGQGMTNAITWIATTTGHKINAWRW